MSNRGRGRGRGNWNNANKRDVSNNNSLNNGRVNRNQRNDNLNTQDIERENVRVLSNNFSSSELTFQGSDKIIFVPNEDEIKSIWTRMLRRDFKNQHEIRRFLNSCLAVTSERSGFESEELVAKLSTPDGRQRLREIFMFPVSVDAGLQPRVASFQRVTLPFLALLTRSAISECILESNVNAIYLMVHANLEDFLLNKVIHNLETLVQRNSLVDRGTSQGELIRDDPNSFIPTSLGQFFLVIVRLCNTLLNRIKDTLTDDVMLNIVQRLEKARENWHNSFLTQQNDSNDPLYSDIEKRNYFFHILDKEFGKVKQMVRRHMRNSSNDQRSNNNSSSYQDKAQIADLKRSYDPPGELSELGPRHNNDCNEISNISIIPTKEEMLSNRPPFLPTNLPGAPHFLPEGAARLLDSQFRLLREDMLSPIRGGIINFLQFLADPNRNESKLTKFKEVGGRFRYENGQDNGDLFVYANARFVGISIDRRRGFSCRVAFTAPKRTGRTERDRIFYWQRSKKLMNGNLVCLLWPLEETNNNVPNATHYSLFFGVVIQRDEKRLAKYEDRVEIDINFTDASVYPLASKDISNQKNKNADRNTSLRFMVECTGVYLESYYHILKTLQSSNESMLPFEKYLTLAGNDDENENNIGTEKVSIVDVPDYARAPGFHFNLSVLLHNKQQRLLLNVTNTGEHKNVIRELENGSILDDTQAKALVSALCKEIALIEGPPGTGKTVVGVEIMKVLLAKENRNIKLSPILTICFTNHALDQFLEHLIDKAGIDNIVRLGGRSKSDKISPFGLEEIARNRDKPTGVEGYLLAKAYGELENIQKEADKIQKRLNQRWLSWEEISSYLCVDFNGHHKKFFGLDHDIPNFLLNDSNEEWEVAGKDGRYPKCESLFEKWLHGIDIKNARSMIQAMENQSQLRKEKKKDNDPNFNTFDTLANYNDELEEYYKPENHDDDFFEDEDEEYYDDYDQSESYNSTQQNFLSNWEEPKTNRSLEELKDDTNVWNMSTTERITLHDFWRHELNLEYVEKLEQLQKIHDEKRKEVDDIHNERRKKILKECDVIGMTTNGAAKFQSLIRSVSPKVIICEEAGEVLEAHILSALTPSTQHLILIGDHNQLRPHIANYNLSCDSKVGKKYGLDESLFERLVKGDKATRIEKSQLLTQRRMRREIADLIRETIPVYRNLKDDNTDYPKVRGVQHNVYFVNHRNCEDATKNEFAIQSHSNQYEVDMVIEMVKYFVRNGYTKQDDIAVLTPYLGQMMKLRDALKATFTVVIDERDGQNLAEMEDDNEENEDEVKSESTVVEKVSIATRKSLNQQVTLRTVDNFQGEEANIVIVSLVRNSSRENNRGSIGFLKSTNRSNVLLSRAKHGMYLLGNAELMANESPEMWSKIVQILKSRNQVGDSFPIICPQHSYNKNYVKEPQQFAEFAPDGGCLESCGQKLDCGHLCPYKCHFDNPDHINVYCRKECTRLHPGCNHPCNKLCGDKCGDCTLNVGDITLPSCGHTYQNAKCYENRNINSILCSIKVQKTLPKCGHKIEMKCCESVDNIICKQPCGVPTNCGHNCSTPCNECQKRSIKANNDVPPLDENGYIKRTVHGFCRKICERTLFCGHKCEEICHEGKLCKPCVAPCTVSCSHSSCRSECYKPCTSCAEPCNWHCPHEKGRCLLSCGAPCSRLPCNERCEKALRCGHRCPGVCGEICPTPKFCEICAPDDVKEQMIDYYEFKTFAQIDWGKERMIILECGHIFTMETMDHHMEMEKYYECDGEYGNWTDIVMLSSQTGENKIMTCPTCRAPIRRINRYGRSIKKRVLDTQNKKFLTKYDDHLKYLRKKLETIMRKIESSRPDLLEKFKNRSISSTSSNRNEVTTQNRIIPEVVMSEKFLLIDQYYSIPEKHAILWKSHVRELLISYQHLMKIMSDAKNPPYKKAFEAAVTRLYNQKTRNQIDSLIDNFENLRTMEESELPKNQKARFEQSLREVGLIAPQFDRRIYLDAFFEIINIQKIMFDETTRIISELPKTETHDIFGGISVLTTQKNWTKFCQNIIDSIENHLGTIIQTCRESKYGRHLVVASLEYVEFEYQVGKFTLNNPPDNIMTESIKIKLKEKCDKIRNDCDQILKNILPKVELPYFEEQCVKRIDKLLKNVDELHEAVENYRKLSIQEKIEIFRAMSSEFSGSGHWYECPNGHPYTIGECGGAMQSTRCPDCGVTIGGEQHVLTEGNRRNHEFETLNTGGTRFF